MIVALGLAAWGGCGSTTSDERSDVLRVMEAGRTALLAGDGQSACSLLTAHGRTRALGFQADSAQTCEALVGAESRREHLPGTDQSWTPDLKAAKFNVVSIDGDSAQVRLKVPSAYGPTVDFSLRKTEDGWRIDDSDAVPSGD